MMTSSLKILVVLQTRKEATALERDLEFLGHRVQLCWELNAALGLLRRWQPDLVVTEESLRQEQPDEGLRLAEYCRLMEDGVNGWLGTPTLMFIPTPDWDRFKRAQRTGAHALVKGRDLDSAIRYIQTVADNLVTDRVLGPALVGIHRFTGDGPCVNCENCEWTGATVSYGSSQIDVEHLTPVRIAILNALLFHRRAQSPLAIVNITLKSRFLKRVLQGHDLRESALKMEVTRLRHNLGNALEAIGAPLLGSAFPSLRLTRRQNVWTRR